jgi:radical SAM protein with 4Fe4S-binding SPASM domain
MSAPYSPHESVGELSHSDIDDLVSSGLDHMIVSVDGTTQEVYEKYRRGGNLELVLENASAIIAKRNKSRTKRPLIEFKFILFDHNRKQLDEARELSETMGFDRFSVVWDNASPETAATLKRARSRNLARNRACFWPWSSVVFRWDGTVWPCCSNRSVMGNIFEQDFAAIWNNERYQRMRKFHRTREPADVARQCAHCMHF